MGPIFVPVTIHAIIGSEDIIDAMDLRAFGVGLRTWLKDLKYARRDYFILGLGVAIFITCCVLKWGFGIGGFFVPDFFLNALAP